MSAKDKAIEVLKSYTSWQGSFSNSQVVRAMLDFADQQTEELQELLPESFYANTPLEHRIKMMVDIWNRSVKAAQELQEELDSYKSLLDDGVNEVKKLQKENDRLKGQAFKDYSEYMNDSEVDEDNKKDFNEWIDSLPIQSPAAEVSDEIPDEQIDYLLKDQMGLPHYVKYESAPTLKATYDYGKRILEMVRSKLQGRKEGWVSVKDRLPESSVIVAVMDNHNQKDTGYHESGKWYTESPVGSNGVQFWYPLPSPPTEGREG